MLTPGSEVLATAYSDPEQAEGHGQGRAGHLGEPATARAGSTRTCWATTPRRWPTPITRSGCAGASSGRPPARRNEPRRDARPRAVTPPGQRDYSTVRLSRHALERFVERFAAEPEAARRRAAPRPGPDAAPRAQSRERGDRRAGHLSRPGPRGHPPGGDLPDRPDLEPVRSAAGRVRPEQAARASGDATLRRLTDAVEPRDAEPIDPDSGGPLR